MVIIGAITNFFNVIKEAAKRGSKEKLLYLPEWYYQRELADPTDKTSLLNAFKSWVYVCASRNAISVANYPLRLYIAKPSQNSKLLVKTRKITPETKKFLYSKEMGHLDRFLTKAFEIEEVLEHPFLELMKKVNPFMNAFELKEMTDLHQELTGNSYWYILSNNAGMPVELWIVPPDKMKIVPSKEEFLKGYLYSRGMDSISFDRLEIIHHKFPSPTSAYYGMSPLSAVTHAYNINENMNLYENALFSNMARPDGVLETEQSLGTDEFKRLKKEWKQEYGGTKKAGKTALLEKGLKYKPIALTPRELSYLAGRKVTKEEICNAYGQSLALYDKDANRANADNATYIFMRDTISPRHRRQEQKINEQLLPRYDERLFCAFEDCVPEDREFKHKVRNESVNKLITINEGRQEIGKEEVEGGDNLYINSRLVPIGTPSEKEVDEVSAKIAEKVKEKLNA